MDTSSTSTRRRRRKPRRSPPPPPTTSSPPTPSSPYLTPEEAARYLRYSTVHALRQATKTMGIPCIRRGRRIFYKQSDLDEFMAVVSQAGDGRRRRR